MQEPLALASSASSESLLRVLQVNTNFLSTYNNNLGGLNPSHLKVNILDLGRRL